jgi:hypothetical protein
VRVVGPQQAKKVVRRWSNPEISPIRRHISTCGDDAAREMPRVVEKSGVVRQKIEPVRFYGNASLS